MKQESPFSLFTKLRWVDGRPLISLLEPYRRDLFERAYQHDDGFEEKEPGTISRVDYNLILCGRAKKNWKTGDLAMWSLYKLLMWKSWNQNQIYTIANDEDQAADDLELGKLLIRINKWLQSVLTVKQNVIERKDGRGFWEILPAGDVVGTHGKTYLLCGFDEIHGYKNWDIIEAMQLDPSRPDAQMWLTSYASIYHRPGVPLFDLFQNGKKGTDPRMLFQWYAADYCTDPAFEEASPEDKANPSRASWGENNNYLEQQKARLPSHKYRRLHLNLPGSPEGTAFSAEKVMDAIERGVKSRPPVPDVEYCAFVDMSGGSNDDATLAIAHRSFDGRLWLDLIVDQGQRPPFDPRKAVERFAGILKQRRIFSVLGDKYGGETFICEFESLGISYCVSDLSTSELYEAMEPHLNSGKIVLLDVPTLESQLLGLVWRGGKIDHPAGTDEHDDWANSCAGALWMAASGFSDALPEGGGSRMFNTQADWGDPVDNEVHPMDRLIGGNRRFWD